MPVHTILLIILFVAFLGETLTELLFGTFANLIESIWPKLEAVLERPKFRMSVIQLFAISVGIAGAFIYRFDVIYLLGQYLQEFAGVPLNIPLTVYGLVITGVAIGKGSNYIHDFLNRFFIKPTPLKVIQTDSVIDAGTTAGSVAEIQRRNYV